MAMELKFETEGMFKNLLLIADNHYLEQLESPNTSEEYKKRLKKIIYDKTFRTKFNCTLKGFVTDEGYENVVVIHLVKKGVEPQMEFEPKSESISVTGRCRQQKLGCDTASFSIYSKERCINIHTLADGGYGQSFATANETLILLSVTTDATDIDTFFSKVEYALDLSAK